MIGFPLGIHCSVRIYAWKASQDKNSYKLFNLFPFQKQATADIYESHTGSCCHSAGKEWLPHSSQHTMPTSGKIKEITVKLISWN